MKKTRRSAFGDWIVKTVWKKESKRARIERDLGRVAVESKDEEHMRNRHTNESVEEENITKRSVEEIFFL